MIQRAIPSPRYQAITRSNVSRLPQWRRLDHDLREAIEVVSLVLPFRTNRYVIDHLIDWGRVPDDPMFQLTFPQRGMLAESHFAEVARLADGDDPHALRAAVARIHRRLNPQPAGQLTHNQAFLDGRPLAGVQHKYRETVLFFPSPGQTCHAYCTFCFRWAQFVGMDDMKLAGKEVHRLVRYLRAHPRVTDVLLTGGDPLVMKSRVLARYVEALLTVRSVSTIRIGTKAPAYWPHRFVTDDDADDLLRLFERVVGSGRHLALMGHYSHPVELSTPVAREAVRRIRATGANIRMQSPIVRHVNDRASTWADLWQAGVRLGCLPYYMFIERNTGAKAHFEMPLVQCWNIFRNAYQQVSGLARTARGPVMSCFPGKCHIVGVTEIGGRQAFCLQYLQAREPDLVRRPFFAHFDPRATWYDQLQPLTRSDRPFFVTPASPHAASTMARVRSNT